MHQDTVYPLLGSRGREEAASKVLLLCRQYQVEAIAVGNGTAGRETEAFLRKLDLDPQIAVVMVNESGASVYSASDAARTEFPDQDITVRGAVSIGRRLMDPLAELVKIDPKSIGVGQYQHDVDQKALRQRLDDVVASCVNSVGVELNTGQRPVALVCFWPWTSFGQGNCGVPERQRPVCLPAIAEESASPGSQGFRAGGRVLTHQRR